MVLEIVKYPDPTLNQVAEPVTVFDSALAELAEKMFETMYEAHGVGLAGPQVARNKRIFVVNIEPGNPTKEAVFVNPVITASSGEQIGEEGCLSIPGVGGKVARAVEITVDYQDVTGAAHTGTFTDYFARAIQHELDHLDGKLFIDKISYAEKEMAAGRLKELRAEYAAKQKKIAQKAAAKEAAKKGKRPRIKKQ